jgi:hypothetical protein
VPPPPPKPLYTGERVDEVKSAPPYHLCFKVCNLAQDQLIKIMTEFILKNLTTYLFFITEGAVLELSPYERNEICTSVIQQIVKYNLPLYITTIERSLGNLDENFYSHGDIAHNIDDHKEQQLKKLMDSIYSLTGKKDLLLKLR